MADYVPVILSIFKWICYGILGFYIIRVIHFIFWGSGERHRMREAMAVGYTVVAAYCIYLSTSAILPFIQSVLNASTRVVQTPTFILNSILIICAGLVCVAFICNFSRSLWMLKSLDHAVFEPVPEWETLSAPPLKRFLEFTTRTIAAVLFIILELQLKKVADPSGIENVGLITVGEAPKSHFADAGFYGLLLYGFLGLWWLSGLYIAERKMPKKLLIFYLMGLINSLFILLYGKQVASDNMAELMLLIVFGMGVGAAYMLLIVLSDIYATVRPWFKKAEISSGNDLANA